MKIIYFLFAVVIPLHCNAESRNVTECIGNLDINFPDEVEIAANSADMLIQEHEVGTIQPRFEFMDGERAGWSSISYNGKFLISHFLNNEQKNTLRDLQEKRKLRVRKFSIEKKKKIKAYFLKTCTLPPLIV